MPNVKPVATAVCVLLATFGLSGATARAASTTTAWHAGQFQVDTPNLVRSADVVLRSPNIVPQQAMPLGNGTLGASVWAANGLTAQLNRSDTLPDRKSPGWLVVPGLARLTSAKDFAAHLDLYDGTLVETGDGMSATVSVRADSDQLVVDVTGADPNSTQTADIQLWQGRSPKVTANGPVATLAETWVDNTQPGNSGRTFGSLAALTANGRAVSAKAVDSQTARVSFTPNANGSFQVVVGAPKWAGGAPITTVKPSPMSTHLQWWHDFWARVGLIHLHSADGSADYLENLRTLDLYTAAASSRGQFPGSQAGVADLFSPVRDDHKWDPAAYWHWNLRMQVAANLGAGAFDLNTPYFQLYQQNLSAIQGWTKAHMAGRAGVCVPETMRFNGQGIEYETWLSTVGLNCDSASAPYYNARTISTGAEVGLWVWQQYRMTGDKTFLQANYPLMAEAARFLLAYATTGADKKLHTYPSNAHETQWDVHDPTTDLAAMSTLFPATIAAAGVLSKDADLVAQLRSALPRIPALPVVNGAIVASSDPGAATRNSENIGLEPVWPYGMIGDQGPQTALARQTFTRRPNVQANDWSNDPIQAARLGLGDQVASTLVGLTEKYQKWPAGFATFVGSEPYGEQQGVAAAAINESLAQDYDGLLRIAPAIPTGWDADGTVFIQGNNKVSLQVHSGQITTVGLNAGSTGTVHIRNPWPGQRVEVVDGVDEKTSVVASTTAATFDIPVTAGKSYLVQRVDSPVSALTFAPLTAQAATQPRTLGPVTIGVPPTR